MSLTLITLLLFLSLFLSCQKSPVGFDEMARKTPHISETMMSKDSFSFGNYFPCGRASELFLGKNEKYETRILLSFPLIDSAPQNITKIRLIFYTTDTTKYQFKIYPLTTRWSEDATWRMASSDIQWINPGGDFLNLVLGEGSVQKDSFSIEIPRNFLDTLLHTATGLIIVPEENRNLFRFASFKSGATKLIFTYGEKDRTFIPQFDTYIVNLLDTLPPNSFALGSGFLFKTYLLYPLQLGKEYKIAEGELTLSLNLSASYLLSDTLEIAVYKLKGNFWERLERTFYEPYPSIRKTIILPTDTIITLPAKGLLEDWQNNPENNFGIFLTLYPEYRFPSYLILKRDTQNFRMKYIYIPPVKDRFP